MRTATLGISTRKLGLKAKAAARPAIEAISVKDPLKELVQKWIAERDLADNLVAKWQNLENSLSLKVRSRGMDLNQAVRSGLPEARTMRALMRQIRKHDRRLSDTAQHILTQRPLTASDALSKIQLGLRMQQPALGEDTSWALVKAGFAEFSSFARPGDPVR